MKLTREQIQRDHIPESYQPRAHVAAIILTVAAVVALCCWQLRALQPWHGLVFVGTIVFTNLGEYWLHRGPFHFPVKGFERALYHRHTTMHHAMFAHDTMECDSARDLKWILLPAWGYAAVCLIVSPLVALLYWWEPNAACMYLLAMCTYYVVYELLHTASHLPETSALGKTALVRAVTYHHRVHHDRRLMRRYNFNFAFPIFDWVFGTWYREEHEAALQPDLNAPSRE